MHDDLMTKIPRQAGELIKSYAYRHRIRRPQAALELVELGFAEAERRANRIEIIRQAAQDPQP
jgi:hypothetical protein